MQKASDALAAIRKESLDVYSRLQSIAEDVQFVHQVRAAYPHLPVLRTWSSSSLAMLAHDSDSGKPI
jgi:hypothetical protein